MTPEELERLATMITDNLTDRLAENVIPGTIHQATGKWLAENCGTGIYYKVVIPLRGPECIVMSTIVAPPGIIQLTLQYSNGEEFWRGTLTPVPATR